MTITEKILARGSGRNEVKPLEFIYAKVDGLLGHDLKLDAFKEFEEIRTDRVFDADKIWIIFDHHVPSNTAATASQCKGIREYVEKYGITNFYDVGRGGICHVVAAEEGLAGPGKIIIGGDSHTCTAGALGAFATGVGNTDFASIMALGEVWLRVPESIKIVYKGVLPPWITGKDLILYTLKQIRADGALYKAVEFCGPIIQELSVEDRFTMCNMAVELGAKNGIIAPDEKTKAYLSELGIDAHCSEDLISDDTAFYSKIFEFDCSHLRPQVALPSSPDNVDDVENVRGIKIDQVFIGSCTNGRITDLRQAAQLLKGKKVHPQVRLIVIPGSQRIYRQALEEGIIDIFLDSNAIVGPPTCGPCSGGHMGLLSSGEVCLSTSNRNFRGRMGDSKSKVYLSSIHTAAASAIMGCISLPEEVI